MHLGLGRQPAEAGRVQHPGPVPLVGRAPVAAVLCRLAEPALGVERRHDLTLSASSEVADALAVESVSPGNRSLTIVARLILVVAAGLLSVVLVVAFADLRLGAPGRRDRGDRDGQRRHEPPVERGHDARRTPRRRDVRDVRHHRGAAGDLRRGRGRPSTAQTMLEQLRRGGRRGRRTSMRARLRRGPAARRRIRRRRPPRWSTPAGTDHAAAAAALAGLPEASTPQLEEELGALDDGMLAAVQAASEHGAGLQPAQQLGHRAGRARRRAAHRGGRPADAAGHPAAAAGRCCPACGRVAGCDLTVRVPVLRRDELGAMAASLNEAIGSIRDHGGGHRGQRRHAHPRQRRPAAAGRRAGRVGGADVVAGAAGGRRRPGTCRRR